MTRAKCYIIACAVCSEFTEVSRRGVLTCSPRCRAVLKRHPEIVKKLRERCELAAGFTPSVLLQAIALNALTDCAGVRLPEDLWDRFWTGDIQPQEASAWAAATSGIHTNNGSQHEKA